MRTERGCEGDADRTLPTLRLPACTLKIGPMDNLPIVILAAGSASRMRGRDKLLEDVAGQSLIRRQAMMARAVTRGPVIVALPPRPHQRYAALEELDVDCLPVMAAAEGMGASIRAAAGALPPDAAYAMIVLGDMPDLTENDLKKIIESVDFAPNNLAWRGQTSDGRPGHPIIFHADLFGALRALKGDSGGREVVAAAGARVHYVRLPGNRARLDLDTPEDWAAWRARRDPT